MKIDKSILGVAGEYYVAAELGKRNIYAQITLGNQKRADLLIFSNVDGTNDKLLKIEVKCKQGREWPNCKGIYSRNSFIVFVDFKDIASNARPDFYILSVDDWINAMKIKMKEYKAKHPEREIELDDKKVLVFKSEVNKYGKPYMGCGIIPKDIANFKEAWDKIISNLDDL